MDYIKKYFDTLNITITPTVCQRMHQITAHWEIKGTHPLTLNGQTLGVYRVVFTDNDRTAFFHCVDLEEPDVKHIVRECSRAATPSPIDLSLPRWPCRRLKGRGECQPGPGGGGGLSCEQGEEQADP